MAPRPQQAGVIPFRRSGNSVSLCLITAASSHSWGIPKGTIERGSSPEETALEEAWEEAGLRGRILGDSLGSYEYEKAGVLLTVALYLMEVEIEAQRWDEHELRRRRWVPARDAARILKAHPAWPLIEEACRRLSGV
jgi:8-oxo-dGTP pyrophosphatase MutT (NUDIX family)